VALLAATLIPGRRAERARVRPHEVAAAHDSA
jgi:hypothetical protein